MAWIKRNLYFVITVAAGLIVTGYCGYLLFSALAGNKSVSEEYASTLESLQHLEQTKPYPSKENIQAAKADQERVRRFLADFRRSFSSFPPPPKEDARGFNEYLLHSIRQFGQEATNAGVLLPDDFFFAFQNQRENLTYPPDSLGPWMAELAEIHAILRVLYRAKISYLEHIYRPPVCPEDNTGGDILQAITITNQLGATTPYRIEFRGFSTEIAAVLAGFAGASNCFIVKTIDVTISRAPLPQVIAPAPAVETPTVRTYNYAPQPMEPNPYMMEGRGRGGRGEYPGGYPGMYGRRPMQPGPQEAVPVAPVPSGPVSILTENPLYVTMTVDVVKLKSAEK